MIRWYSRQGFYIFYISWEECWFRIAGYGMSWRWTKPYTYLSFQTRRHLKDNPVGLVK